jgi:hypothetical protein
MINIADVWPKPTAMPVPKAQAMPSKSDSFLEYLTTLFQLYRIGPYSTEIVKATRVDELRKTNKNLSQDTRCLDKDT